MAMNIKAIYQGHPAAAGGTLATVPASTKWIVTNIIIASVVTSTKWVSLSRVANGGSNGISNRLFHQLSIGALQVVTFDVAIAMDTAGDFLWGQQETASSITLTVSGVAQT